VEGLRSGAEAEVVSVLGQGVPANVLQSGAVTGYELRVSSGKRTSAIRAEQRNGKLWVDWILSGAGTFEVGTRGWQLPIEFALPEQEVHPRTGMTLAADAAMRYSSIRPGPEDETKLVTTIRYSRGGEEYVYRRTCELRPIALEADSEIETWGPLPGGGPCGTAASWARTATLATLGVQPLAGVRETGLAMWTAQAGADRVAGQELSRSADDDERGTIKRVAKLTPAVSAPPELVTERLARGVRARVVASMSLPEVESKGPAPSSRAGDSSVVTDFSAALRWKVGERWRIGAGLDGLLVLPLDGRGYGLSWSYATVTGRVEYVGRRVKLGLSGGPMWVDYASESPTYTAIGDLGTYVLGLDLEWSIAKKAGLFARARPSATGGSELALGLFQAGMRWYYTRNSALQLHYTRVSLEDEMGVGGQIRGEGSAVGFGVATSW
jgi:hypothetical protein